MEASNQQSLVTYLQNALNPNQAIRTEAENYISALPEQNFPLFMNSLAEIIQNESYQKEIRQMAATVIKNSISKYSNQWVTMNAELKTKIKNCVLSTLASKEIEIRKASSFVIAGMVKIDLPNNQWLEIFDVLSSASNNEQIYIRLTAITALKYIFQEINKKDIPEASILQVLNAIFNILQDRNNVPELLMISLEALEEIVAFLGNILKNQTQMDYFFNKVKFFLTSSTVEDVRKAAISVLIELIKTYYDDLKDKSTEIVDVTTYLLKNETPRNAIFVYEVWCTICDIEIQRFKNSIIPKECLMMAQRNCEVLFDIIKTHLVINEYDNDEWNISDAAACLLSLLSQCCNQVFITTVVESVGTGISKPRDEHQLHATIVAFGSIMDSCHHEYLIQIAKNGTDIIAGFITNPSSPKHIKIISAATIKKISECFGKDFSADKLVYNKLIRGLLKMLDINDNEILVPICSTFHALARGVPIDKDIQTNALSDTCKEILDKLLTLVFKTTSYDQDHNVALAAFISIGTIAERSAKDVRDTLKCAFEKLLTAFEFTFQNQGFPSEEARLNYQLYILSDLSSFALSTDVTEEQVNKLYNLTVRAFNERKEIMPEGLEVMGSIAEILDNRLAGIMNNFGYFLVEGLKCINMKDTCKAAIFCLISTIRALKSNYKNYAQNINDQIYKIMMCPDVDKDLKPLSFSIITDLFIYCKECILPSFKNIMDLIQVALSAANTLTDDPDFADYYMNLRENIIETLSIIFQTCKETGMTQQYAPYIPDIMKFLFTINKPEYLPTFSITKESLGLISDFCCEFTAQMKPLLDLKFLEQLVANVTNYANENQNTDIMAQFIQYVRDSIKNALNNN
ncbi:MAG: hypothetical protein MJ252_10135 [archaeon]|nr:hypothetical protein [archaeon]